MYRFASLLFFASFFLFSSCASVIDFLFTTIPEEGKPNEIVSDKVIEIERYEIILEKKVNETRLTVEIMPGKTILVDCNSYFCRGEFLEKKDEHGYPYHVFKDPSFGGTRVGCPPGYVKKMQFVFGSKIIPYDSRIPIVIFVPKSFEVKYCIIQDNKPIEIKNAIKKEMRNKFEY